MCWSRPTVYAYMPNFILIRIFCYPLAAKKRTQILPVFGFRHFVMWLIGGIRRKLNTTANLPLSNGIKTVSVLQQLHGEIVSRISMVQKRERHRQTDKQTKNSTFWPPRRRVKSDPHQNWHGDRGPRALSCSSKIFGLRCIFLPLGGAENLGENRHPQLKTVIANLPKF